MHDDAPDLPGDDAYDADHDEAGTDAPFESLRDLAARIAREHEVIVERDDPVLIVHTINQAFAEHLDATLKTHAAKLKRLQEATAEALVAVVEQNWAGFKEKTVQASLEHSFALVREAQTIHDDLNRANRRSVRALAVLSAINVVCVLAGLGVLSQIVR